jgi:predicted transcriptional regulator
MPKRAEAQLEQSRLLPAVAYEVYRAFLHGKTQAAIAREFNLDPRTAKKYIEALLKEDVPLRQGSRERRRQETLAKLRRVYQHARSLLEADPTDTAALNVVVRTLREESKLQGLYEDVAATVEHRGAIEIRVVYKNDWRGGGQTRPTNVGAGVALAPTIVEAESVAAVAEGEAQ